MKRTLDIVKGFEQAKDTNPDLSLIIAGDTSGSYARKVIAYVKASGHSNSIQVLGRVSDKKRLELMRDAAVIVVTSIKEGWGLIVTEANSQGTPAVAYDVDGLRDSISDGQSGLLVDSGDVKALGVAINNILSDTNQYEQLRDYAWRWSKEFTFENSYADFCSAVLARDDKH
jgi:glycosyltransferase involved in cell wall biosynthesis